MVPGSVAVRDSKDPAGPVLIVAPAAWDAFRAGLVRGADAQRFVRTAGGAEPAEGANSSAAPRFRWFTRLRFAAPSAADAPLTLLTLGMRRIHTHSARRLTRRRTPCRGRRQDGQRLRPPPEPVQPSGQRPLQY
ncbi:DUF397 domain-containing protein [Streptomyces sp. NPDC057545]|uniref:DUF397 domain-containing protein n=1 Tax=unclassified Streptomyces TaxID=2593676 RepID=UPI0036BAD44E